MLRCSGCVVKKKRNARRPAVTPGVLAGSVDLLFVFAQCLCLPEAEFKFKLQCAAHRSGHLGLKLQGRRGEVKEGGGDRTKAAGQAVICFIV